MLAHQAKVFQALGRRVHEGRGKGGIIALNDGIARDAGRRATVAQLPEVRHNIRDAEGRVRVQGYGWDFKLLIAQTGRVEGLQREESLMKRYGWPLVGS